jgi:hypothetical protein
MRIHADPDPQHWLLPPLFYSQVSSAVSLKAAQQTGQTCRGMCCRAQVQPWDSEPTS